MFRPWCLKTPPVIRGTTAQTREASCSPILCVSASHARPDFLSWLRLSIYMAVVSVAIILNFQLRAKPSPLERRMALPLGIVFWLLSLLSLGTGLFTYLKTCAPRSHSIRVPADRSAFSIQKYSRRAAIVQSGTKTQIVVLHPELSHCSLLISSVDLHYPERRHRWNLVRVPQSRATLTLLFADGFSQRDIDRYQRT